MDIKVDMEVAVHPYVDADSLLVDLSLDGDDWYTEKMKLTTLFSDYVDARKVYGTGEIRIADQKDIANMVALLRYIAREMENELEASRG